MVEIKNVFAGYGKKEILHGVSLNAEAGCITTILGANGCGKSTLLKTINGIVPIDRGEVLLSGGSIKHMRPPQIAQMAAYLPQNRATPDITVGRLVLHGRFPYLRYPRRYSPEDHRIACDAMEKLGISSLEHTPLAELSGGTRQKTYLAMALAQRSQIILMDEPTAWLDLGEQVRFAQMLRELKKEKKTVVLVLHDLLLALKLSDKLCVMDQGTILAQGTPEQIFSRHVLSDLYGIKIGKVDGQYYLTY